MTGEPLKEDSVTASPRSSVKVKSGAGSPSRTTSTSKRRAVGIVRVSRVGGRDGEQFVSPSEQAERIRTACARDDLTLVETIEEMDISGGAALEKRPGLSRAVELVEAGEADVVVVAFFDRLVRSLSVQAEVVGRVEAAGGAILAVDVGQVTHDSAGQWLSGTMLGAVSEYARRVTSERTADSKRRAVARGVPPFPNLPPGYKHRTVTQDGRVKVVGIAKDSKKAQAIRKAFEMRASGATVMEVRAFLKRRRIARSFHGTQSLLSSRFYLGELHFGALVNLDSHEAIVDVDTWTAVQRMKSTRGRRAKSDRLLARLGVLRCGTCGARMVVGSTRQQGKPYAFYRCNPTSDCPARVTISADLAETAVIDAVQEYLRGVKGTASIADGLDEAMRACDRAEHDLASAVEAFDGLDDVPAAREKLMALRDVRDQARDRLAELEAAAGPAVTVTAEEFTKASSENQRALIRAVIAEAVVAPGRGSDRITVRPRSD
jgi:DNA invertase Pin-like site-specific DNA recombinase